VREEGRVLVREEVVEGASGEFRGLFSLTIQLQGNWAREETCLFVQTKAMIPSRPRAGTGTAEKKEELEI
jgi:hypothetical protein